jgi:hypothetical protein
VSKGAGMGWVVKSWRAGAGAATPVARRRPRRASLRESPLAELFRATVEQ